MSPATAGLFLCAETARVQKLQPAPVKMLRPVEDGCCNCSP